MRAWLRLQAVGAGQEHNALELAQGKGDDGQRAAPNPPLAGQPLPKRGPRTSTRSLIPILSFS